MNRDNLKKIINRLKTKKNDLGFNMGYMFITADAKPDPNNDHARVDVDGHFCSSVGCIAGHITFMEKGPIEAELIEYKDKTEEWAAEFLGLGEEAHQLFYPDFANSVNWNVVKRADAVRVLEHLLETGYIDWSILGHPMVPYYKPTRVA